MKSIAKLFLPGLLLLSAVLIGGCSTGTLGETVTQLKVKVVATMNFGKDMLFEPYAQHAALDWVGSFSGDHAAFDLGHRGGRHELVGDGNR